MSIGFHQILSVISIAIFFTNVPDYARGRLGILYPNLWVAGLGVLALPLLTRQMTKSEILRSPVLIWCAGYAWVTIVWFLGSSQSDVGWQAVRSRFLSIIELLLFLAIFADHRANKVARQALVVAVFGAVLLQVYEMFFPMSFSEILGRSAGLYMNPNAAGIALVTGMICAVTVLPLHYRCGFLLMTGIGVMASVSRASILAWGIGILGLLVIRRVRFRDIVFTGTMGLVVVVLMLIPRWDEFAATLERNGSINKNVEERLGWLADPSGVSDASSWSRIYVAKRAWDRIGENPFLGNGTGSSFQDEIAPHNQSLALMQDHGVLGALILPLLLLAVILSVRGENQRTAIVFSVTVMFLSFFSHDVLSARHTLLLLALVATLSEEKGSDLLDSPRVTDSDLHGRTPFRLA